MANPNMPFHVGNHYLGMLSCTLVGSKVYMVGSVGRQGDKGMTFGICDLQEKKWEWVENTDEEAPFVRGNAAFLVDDSLYVFGGSHQDWYSREVYKLDFALSQWAICPTIGEKPAGRMWLVGEYIEETNDFVMFSGSYFDKQEYCMKYLNDLWVLNLDQMRWTIPRAKGRAPSPRRACCSCVVDQRMYIFGGNNDDTYFAELHILDCVNSTYTWMEPILGLGITRSGASLTSWNGHMFLYGGKNAELLDSNDLHIVELPSLSLSTADKKGSFSKYTVEGYAEETLGHTCIVLDNEMYVFAGFGRSHHLEVLKAAG